MRICILFEIMELLLTVQDHSFFKGNASLKLPPSPLRPTFLLQFCKKVISFTDMHVLAISDKFTNHKKKQNDSGGIAPLSFFLPRIILKMIPYTNIHVLGLINNLFLRHSRKKNNDTPPLLSTPLSFWESLLKLFVKKNVTKWRPKWVFTSTTSTRFKGRFLFLLKYFLSTFFCGANDSGAHNNGPVNPYHSGLSWKCWHTYVFFSLFTQRIFREKKDKAGNESSLTVTVPEVICCLSPCALLLRSPITSRM